MRPASPSAPHEPDKPNPFPYGWRYVKRTLPDGSTEFDQVPLTMEDVLHPQEEDVIPVRPRHERECGYLARTFRSRPLGPPIVHIAVDQSVNWGIEGLGNPSPDIAVFVGVEVEPDPDNGTFDLASSGGRCLLIVEVVSPHTRDNDVVHKFREYHQAQVPLYVIVDQEREGGPRKLLAYHWEEEGYAKIPLDDEGRVLLPPLGLYLLIRDNWVVCQDAETGRVLVNPAEQAQELEKADRRDQEREQAMEEAVRTCRNARKQAREARKKTRAAEDRIRQLEERLRALEGGQTPPPA